MKKRYKSTEVTNHATRRLKERVGVGRGGVKTKVRKVLLTGFRYPYEVTKNLNAWLRQIDQYQWEHNRKGSRYIVSGHHVFVFTKDYRKLVTVLTIPNEFKDDIMFLKSTTREEMSKLKIKSVEQHKKAKYDVESNTFIPMADLPEDERIEFERELQLANATDEEVTDEIKNYLKTFQFNSPELF